MIKKIILFILLLNFLTPCNAIEISDIKNFTLNQSSGREVLILISDKITTFEEVRIGIYESLNDYNIYHYNFQANTNFMKEIPEIIKRINPNIVVAIGSSVLENLLGKVDLPIIFSMVINYKKLKIENYKNITGVSLQIPIESVFYNFKIIYPNVKNVGIVCSQNYYDSFILPYIDSVKLSLDINIVPKIISSSKEYINSYYNIVKNVDVMWMVPDTSILDKDAIIFFLNESYKNLVPTIVYSEPFVEAGGFFSVSPNYNTIGSQIAIIIRKILEDKISPEEIGIIPIIGTFTIVNREIAKKLKINEDILGLVDKVIK